VTLLDWNSYDGYSDPLQFPLPNGALYKIYIPVHDNRSIETNATLYDANGTVLLQFVVRCHGQNDANGNQFNMFSPNGVTPTGLTTFDLNSPESDPVDYGPYPVQRAVQGLEGNSVFCMSNTNASVRTGILMHTGEWWMKGWKAPMPMPNSDGCIHGWPNMIEAVWKTLVSIGVKVRKNPQTTLFPYPYATQGLLSIEQIDHKIRKR